MLKLTALLDILDLDIQLLELIRPVYKWSYLKLNALVAKKKKNDTWVIVSQYHVDDLIHSFIHSWTKLCKKKSWG